MGWVDPYILTFYRFLFGFYVIFIAVFVEEKHKEIYRLKKKQVFSLFFLGFINIFFSMSMLQLSVKYTTAATAVVIFCSNPIFILLISIIIGDIKLKIINFIPVIFGIIGIFFIMKDKGLVFDNGIIYGLLSSISFSIFSVVAKKTTKDISAITANALSFFFGVLALSLFLVITKRGLSLPEDIYKKEGLNYVISILYLGIMITGVGYLTFFRALKKLKIISTSYIFLLKPIVATILSIIFLKETINVNFWIGLVFIFLGSGFYIFRDKIILTLNKFKKIFSNN